MRYLSENILVVGLYCGLEKPNLGAILEPLAEEMKHLLKGIFIYHQENVIQCVPLIMYCACDLQARSPLQNISAVAGYNGCPSCEHPGVSTFNGYTKHKYVRYLKEMNPSPMRTHRDCVEIFHKIIHCEPIENMKGIKGISPMIGFKYFEFIDGFTTDWMHGSLLGIMKQLMDIWLGKKKTILF